MRTASLVLLAAVSSLAAVTGCSSSTAPGITPDEVTVVASKQTRVTAPNVPAGDAEALREGNTAFATDFYQQLSSDPAVAGENLFFSPYSISLALAMTYAGARGDTATEMATALHYTLPQDRLHPAFNALDLALTSRGESARAADGNAFRLRVTNSIWGAPQTTFEAPFLDTLAQNYGAGIRLTDFVKDAEGARSTINKWVDHETESRIKELLPQSSITSYTRLVLVNAIYFNAAWAAPFEKGATQKGAFHGPGGDVQTELMHQSGPLDYAKGDGYQAVALPYDGNQLSFVAVVPDELGTFEKALSAAQVQAISTSLTSATVDLTLPRFKIEGQPIALRDALEARGMKSAFKDGAADLTGIAPPSPQPLYISDVYHQAFVSVDEAGTEAAAATAVVVNAGSAAPVDPPKVIEMKIDKPFVFFVRDNATGAVLFLGRVVKPS